MARLPGYGSLAVGDPVKRAASRHNSRQ